MWRRGGGTASPRRRLRWVAHSSFCAHEKGGLGQGQREGSAEATSALFYTKGEERGAETLPRTEIVGARGCGFERAEQRRLEVGEGADRWDRHVSGRGEGRRGSGRLAELVRAGPARDRGRRHARGPAR
jgi:hypothetical protein